MLKAAYIRNYRQTQRSQHQVERVRSFPNFNRFKVVYTILAEQHDAYDLFGRDKKPSTNFFSLAIQNLPANRCGSCGAVASCHLACQLNKAGFGIGREARR